MGEIERALKGWGSDEETYAVDGKTLQGSEQAGEDALRVVTMVDHRLRQVIARPETKAVLGLLEAESADARRLKAPFVQKWVEKKKNHLILKQAIKEWFHKSVPMRPRIPLVEEASAFPGVTH